jgi:hypothetical protein
MLLKRIGITILLLVSAASVYAQHAASLYSDRGHWIGGRLGFFASSREISKSWSGTLMYDYRFSENWSLPLELMRFNKSEKDVFLLNGGLRMRIPISYPARNIYGQIGISGGFFVFYGAVGFEYGITDDLALYTQWKTYTANFETIQPHYWLFSIGINYNVTPRATRESYLLE